MWGRWERGKGRHGGTRVGRHKFTHRRTRQRTRWIPITDVTVTSVSAWPTYQPHGKHVNTNTHTHTHTTYALLVFYTFSHYYTCNAFTRGISPPDWRERIVLTVRLAPSRAQNKTKLILLDLVFDSFMVLYVLFYIIIKYKPERKA